MAAMMQRDLIPNDLSGRHSVLRRNDEFFTFADFLKLEEYNTMPFKSILRKATELGIFLTTLTALILAGCGGGGAGNSGGTPAASASDISSYLNEVGGTFIWFLGTVSNRALTSSSVNSYSITDTNLTYNAASGVWTVFPASTPGVRYYSLSSSGWQQLPASATYANNGTGMLTYSMGGKLSCLLLPKLIWLDHPYHAWVR